MSKMLKSGFIVLAVAAIAGIATYSYFSDTETSTGNTFTAGSLDLIVDIDGQDQNPLVDKIFELADMKPGDTGEKTVSLKVDDNPACGTVNVNLTSDLDNSCTEPEIGNEANCATSPTGTEVGSGELNDQVQFIIFSDPDCDNQYNVTNGSQVLTQGTLTGIATYHIGELPVAPAKQCYGIAYCFGAPTVNPNGITCNGANVDNSAQSDSFTADLVITAEQKRNQYPNGCPVDNTPVQMAYVNLENKDDLWVIKSGDGIQGLMQYSVNDTTFHGVINGKGLEINKKYQITLNGPGACTTTDTNLGTFGSNLFQSGFWNNWAPNLSNTCIGTPGEGLYNMNLINDEYTAMSDASGNLNYSFNLNLPNGNYAGVKVLIKKTLDPFVSPWTDSATVHTTNLFEVAPINFTVN